MKHSERLVAAQTEDGRYRLLIEAVTDYAIFMLDPTGIITTWNPGAQRIKGYIASEILGKHFSQFYTEEDQKKGFRRAALETAQREGKFEGEGWRLRQDGTRFWAHVIIDAIHDDDGGFLGYAKITRDITERRDAQQRLEKTREALLQSQKKEAIGQLTGGIAHDFNNLLMAVLSSLELMRKRLPDDPKLLGLLENALQGAHRGASLTQRMLAFAAPAGTQTRGDQYPVTGTRNDRPHSAVAGPIDQHRNALSACDPAGAGRPHATGDGVAVDDDFLILTNTIAILEDLGHRPGGIVRQRSDRYSKDTAHCRSRHHGSGNAAHDRAATCRSGRTEWPDLPVVTATGYAELSQDAGAGLLKLSKPFTEVTSGRKSLRP